MSRHKDEDIVAALRKCRGRIDLAAAALRCNPSTIIKRAKKSAAIASCLQDWRNHRRYKRPRRYLCVHCGDVATMPGDRGPACADCAVELATGQPPPMARITSR